MPRYVSKTRAFVNDNIIDQVPGKGAPGSSGATGPPGSGAALYVQVADPGAVGPNSFWAKTGGIENALYVRDPTNSSWLLIFSATEWIRAAYPWGLETANFADDGSPYPWMTFDRDVNGDSRPVMAWGITGDAYPRVCFLGDPDEGFYFGDGTFDAYLHGAYFLRQLGGIKLGMLTNGNSIAVNTNGFTLVGPAGQLLADVTGIQFIPGGGGTFQIFGTPVVIGYVAAAPTPVDFVGQLFVIPDSAGKLQTRVTFPTGPTRILATEGTGEPPNDSLDNSGYLTWLNDTPGAVSLGIKAKDSSGAVRTATIPLGTPDYTQSFLLAGV